MDPLCTCSLYKFVYIFYKKVKCTLMNKSINIFKKIIDLKHLNKSKI